MIIFGHICVAWSLMVSAIFINSFYIMVFPLIILVIFMVIHVLLINPIFPINTSGGSLIAAIFNPYSAYYYAFNEIEIPVHYSELFIVN